MRLPQPFFRLPIRFDIERLQAEVAALPPNAWSAHPNAIAGNSAARLISVEGGDNDDVNGAMMATAHLRQSPYLQQVLASFGVVWSRSRLLRLAPGAIVPEHADINYHWFNRVRLHVPVTTRPEVRFYCGDENVHMAAGEAWVFDNWRLHRVENPTSHERIHLVADTSGSSNFWQLVASGATSATALRTIPYDAARSVNLLTERTPLAPVMTPGEVDLLIIDLRAELMLAADSPEGAAHLNRYHFLLDALCRDWRQLFGLYGTRQEGWREFVMLRDRVRAASRSFADSIIMRTNRVAAHLVLEGRVLRAMLSLPPGAGGPATRSRRAGVAMESATFDRPIFIVSAPRSGSTLLFETLATSQNLCTVGGEAHWLIEGIPQLRPGAAGVDSNRLTAAQATDDIAAQVVRQILEELQDSQGRKLTSPGSLRFLEKTPKNALRVPFFARIFPDARFIFLWRDPRENIASIMQAWRSGKWQTYKALKGFDGPWSMLLPPGWQSLNGKPLEEIAAHQWEFTNRTLLEDLATLPAEHSTALRYADFVDDPARIVQGLCDFLGLPLDPALAQRIAGRLPYSRYTLTAPDPTKWREDEAAILRVLPSVQATWDELLARG